MLRLENIQGGYQPDSLILQGISMEVGEGEVVGIIGLNGCGKSTLGKAIMNMLPYRTGKVIMNGEDISSRSTHQMRETGIAMVMQGGRVYGQMTVQEHLLLNSRTFNKDIVKTQISAFETQLGCSIFTDYLKAERKGNLLSGGERQFLSLALIFLQKPKLLILDEISAGLSPGKRNELISFLSRVKETLKIGIILIEQNIKIVTDLSERILLLERGTIHRAFQTGSDFAVVDLNKTIFN